VLHEGNGQRTLINGAGAQGGGVLVIGALAVYCSPVRYGKPEEIMPFPRHLLLIPLLLSLLACAAEEQQRHFAETTFAFERAIRWQTLDDAAAFQKEPQSISPRQR